jgi:His/Glu/Gln/Arg/opine family amino acid ABC transporter permease subunit
VIGLAFAFAGTGRVRLLRGLVAGYVTVIRNTPILVIVLIVYFALPELGVRLGKYESFIFSLAIYAAAYLTEVFRAGLTSVPAGVVDAGRAIGLRGVHLSLLVVFPIMLRNALPALGSTFISLFKDTSIAAAIAVPELTFEARKINVESFRVIEAWITATALYVATCALIAAGLRRLERRFPRF